jgi:hypothetical protein
VYFVSSEPKNDTAGSGAESASPLHDSDFPELDYPPGSRPDTAGVAQLISVLVERCAVDGPTAFAAAVQLDQGKAGAAFERLVNAREETIALRQAETERKRRRAGALQ